MSQQQKESTKKLFRLFPYELSLQGIIYWHPLIYHLAIRFLYGRKFFHRYKVVADLIPEGSTVLDICCGDCYLFTHFLKQKNIDYLGWDVSPTFIRWGKSKQIPVEQKNFSEVTEIPQRKVVILMGSFYHFIPHHQKILENLLRYKSYTLIISEPIKNFASSPNRFIRFIAHMFSHTQNNEGKLRFSGVELKNLFNDYQVSRIIETPRDMIGIWE